MINKNLRGKSEYLLRLAEEVSQASRIQFNSGWEDTVQALARSFVDVLANESNAAQALLDLRDSIENADSQQDPMSSADPLAQSLSAGTAGVKLNWKGSKGDAQWLSGYALGVAAGEKASAQALFSLYEVAQSSGIRLHAFFAGLRLGMDENRGDLKVAFREAARAIAVNPTELVYRSERSQFTEALSDWELRTDLVDAWNEVYWRRILIHPDRLFVFNALLPDTPALFLEVCEILKLPPLIDALLDNPDITEDLDLLLELLRLAPTCGEGRQWNKSMSAPLLLQAAFTHISKLFSIESEATKDSGDYGKARREVLTCALNRNDGNFLITGWAIHLIKQNRIRPSAVNNDAINSIIEVIHESKDFVSRLMQSHLETFVPISSDRELALQVSGVGEEKDDAVLDHDYQLLLLTILLTEEDLKSESELSAEASKLYAVFRRLLLERHGELWRHNFLESNWEFPTIARLYRWESTKRWNEDWNTLIAQRRRGLHWNFTEDQGAQEPSLFLASVGVGVVENLLNEHNYHAAVAMCDVVFDAIFPLATQWNTKQSSWRDIAVLVGITATHACKASGDPQLYNVPVSFLKRLGDDDEFFLQLAANMINNGFLDLEDVMNKALGGDQTVHARACRYIKWQRNGFKDPVLTPLSAYWSARLEK
ncbi:MAG TPA: hypothetical protein VE934_08800 [Polaromonas sp.]|uniref:hypothetical protein n=1 Tax=Polaromonas sp. TaxID=1869339 RepID=UPI002D4CEFBD|nr:hypothetical protein [Polaromonas sp.]HYW57047.1 hypothetical protein [Polaromonas sp.]